MGGLYHTPHTTRHSEFTNNEVRVYETHHTFQHKRILNQAQDDSNGAPFS